VPDLLRAADTDWNPTSEKQYKAASNAATSTANFVRSIVPDFERVAPRFNYSFQLKTAAYMFNSFHDLPYWLGCWQQNAESCEDDLVGFL
jgi:hypothetical protein